jgi:DNA-binding FadR family transcriptional regulator
MSDGQGWQSIRKVRAHEQVIEQIEAQILDGRLRVGDRLPSERALGELLGVSRASIREALRVLEALEIITARPGTGSDSGSIISGSPARAMTSLLRLQVALSSFEMDEVIETRVMIESWAVKSAASRAQRDQLEGLERILAEMRDTALEPYAFNELDTAFHVGISEASGNRLTSHLMQAIRDAVRREMMRAFDHLEDWKATAETLHHEHAGILAAVVAGDGELAARLVEQHIRGFYHDLRPR